MTAIYIAGLDELGNEIIVAQSIEVGDGFDLDIWVEENYDELGLVEVLDYYMPNVSPWSYDRYEQKFSNMFPDEEL